jgi:hypothetical protein
MPTSWFSRLSSVDSTRWEKQQCARIDDMEPFVFKALLHFIYTDLSTLGLGVEMTNKDKLPVKSLLVWLQTGVVCKG